MFPAVDVVQ